MVVTSFTTTLTITLNLNGRQYFNGWLFSSTLIFCCTLVSMFWNVRSPKYTNAGKYNIKVHLFITSHSLQNSITVTATWSGLWTESSSCKLAEQLLTINLAANLHGLFAWRVNIVKLVVQQWRFQLAKFIPGPLCWKQYQSITKITYSSDCNNY